MAVSLLSVQIPGQAAINILEDTSVAEGLIEIPCGVDLWNAPIGVVEPSSAADQIFGRLKGINGVGWVTAHKLLARKRPQLLPVYDRVVKGMLQPRSPKFWIPLWETLQDPAIPERLKEIRVAAGLDESISLLRVLDVALWMASSQPNST